MRVSTTTSPASRHTSASRAGSDRPSRAAAMAWSEMPCTRTPTAGAGPCDLGVTHRCRRWGHPTSASTAGPVHQVLMVRGLTHRHGELVLLGVSRMWVVVFEPSDCGKIKGQPPVCEAGCRAGDVQRQLKVLEGFWPNVVRAECRCSWPNSQKVRPWLQVIRRRSIREALRSHRIGSGRSMRTISTLLAHNVGGHGQNRTRRQLMMLDRLRPDGTDSHSPTYPDPYGRYSGSESARRRHRGASRFARVSRVAVLGGGPAAPAAVRRSWRARRQRSRG